MPDAAPSPIILQSSLTQQDAQRIREQSAASDQAAALTPELRSLIHERGWLRMLAPQAVGGAELALPDAVRLEEAIAAADGSAGWTVTLCAGAGWFAGFLPPDLAREIIGTPGVCVGGSGGRTGFADVEGDGFRLNGRWDFATGAPMATHFTMNAVIREGGVPVLDADGNQCVRAFIVPARDVHVHETWGSVGMRATASHNFSVDNAWVAARHAFDIDPARATAPGPLYRFPFVSLAWVTLAANLSGMAIHFLELAAQALARPKLAALPRVGATLRQAQNSLSAARATFYGLLDPAWAVVCGGREIEAPQADALHAASLALVVASRRAVDELYPFCGLYAAHQGSEINRAWRDLHTATQHAMLLPLEP
jgi:alkylation response protein AidB-like acyl-CoA dehydrogenase